MRNDERDVFHDFKRKKYVKSSTWRRRLRRTARKHALTLIRQDLKYGNGKTPKDIAKLIKEWKTYARNG